MANRHGRGEAGRQFQVRANLIGSSEERMEYRMHERDRQAFEKLTVKVPLVQMR